MKKVKDFQNASGSDTGFDSEVSFHANGALLKEEIEALPLPIGWLVVNDISQPLRVMYKGIYQ